MCGTVGAIAERNLVQVLLEGLRRLEYRGYDSAGVARKAANSVIGLRRTVGEPMQSYRNPNMRHPYSRVSFQCVLILRRHTQGSLSATPNKNLN